MGALMQRFEDWPTRLAAFIEARHERAFSWGEADCCLFVCDGVEAMTGADPASRWRGLYSSEKGARRLMRDNGGVFGLASLAFGPPVVSAMAARGDVVLIDTPAGEALAICVGALIAAQGESGIEFHQINAAKAAWKI